MTTSPNAEGKQRLRVAWNHLLSLGALASVDVERVRENWADRLFVSADELIEKGNIGKGLEFLKYFEEFATSGVQAKIADTGKKLSRKYDLALREYKGAVASCTFSSAERALRSYGDTEGLPPEFDKLIRLLPEFKALWNSLLVAVEEDEGIEEYQLRHIELTWSRLKSLCVQVPLSADAFQETLLSICETKLRAAMKFEERMRWVHRQRTLGRVSVV